jgi:alkanesulfonate monooxygenase SsuD/methylene tetrahydromethanopterin reductase-like flavin-dependent oxidoreductase (luciferase family)
LKRAAGFGDGWYGLWRSPEQAREAIATINAFGRKAQFEVSLRLVTRVGAPIPDSEPETTLQGDADAILRKIKHYREAGVDRIVIEPVATDLDDFLRQLAQFAAEIMPHLTSAPSSSSGLAMVGSVDAHA